MIDRHEILVPRVNPIVYVNPAAQLIELHTYPPQSILIQ